MAPMGAEDEEDETAGPGKGGEGDGEAEGGGEGAEGGGEGEGAGKGAAQAAMPSCTEHAWPAHGWKEQQAGQEGARDQQQAQMRGGADKQG